MFLIWRRYKVYYLQYNIVIILFLLHENEHIMSFEKYHHCFASRSFFHFNKIIMYIWCTKYTRSSIIHPPWCPWVRNVGELISYVRAYGSHNGQYVMCWTHFNNQKSFIRTTWPDDKTWHGDKQLNRYTYTQIFTLCIILTYGDYMQHFM